MKSHPHRSMLAVMASAVVLWGATLMAAQAPVQSATGTHEMHGINSQTAHLGGLFLQSSAPTGTFTGNFLSRNFPSFSVTITITQNTNGTLSASATLGSNCISSATLKVSVSGSNISLAGSDTAGDNITFQGTIQSGGNQLALNYIANGSASGRCETDQGTGTLNKQ